MNRKPFAYICSPFRGDKRLNTRKIQEYCRHVYELGYVPIAPNLMFSQFLNNDIPNEREDGIRMALALLRRCRVLVTCGDEISNEMMIEIALAVRLGIVTTTLEGIQMVQEIGKSGTQPQ